MKWMKWSEVKWSGVEHSGGVVRGMEGLMSKWRVESEVDGLRVKWMG